MAGMLRSFRATGNVLTLSCALACASAPLSLQAQKRGGGNNPAPEYPYSIEKIQTPSNSRMGRVVNLDDSGILVGWSFFAVRNPDGGWQELMIACAWDSVGGAAQILPPLSGDSRSQAFASGPFIVGRSGGTPDGNRAVWWWNTSSGFEPRDWNAQAPLDLGLILKSAEAISPDGQYIAFSAGYPGSPGHIGTHTVLARITMDSAGTPTLDNLHIVEDAYPSAIHHVNGVVRLVGAGWANSNQAFYWLTTPDLSSPCQIRSDTGNKKPLAVNGSGIIAGYRADDSPAIATLWSEAKLLEDPASWDNEAVVNLGTLGGASSSAYSINESNQVVGTATTGGKSSESRAVVFRDGIVEDLNTLAPVGKLVLRSALAINNNGQILAEAEEGRFTRHFVLLTPAP